MPEGRPVWKVLPVRLGVTVVLLILAVISALIVVFTGGLPVGRHVRRAPCWAGGTRR